METAEGGKKRDSVWRKRLLGWLRAVRLGQGEDTRERGMEIRAEQAGVNFRQWDSKYPGATGWQFSGCVRKHVGNG